MREIIIMIPLLIVVGGLGVTLGIYISSQIGKHIGRNTQNSDIINNMNKFDKKK